MNIKNVSKPLEPEALEWFKTQGDDYERRLAYLR
jgi:hypothetical protein